jgi:hypothetical protein
MIKEEYYVNLKGKRYPLYAGVLDAATNAGLKRLETELIQIPSAENDHMAIVRATVEMEDGRIFTDYGDCSPRNTSPMIATAAIRMASTRAKGRALRDAINLGETLQEELPDMNGSDRSNDDRSETPSQRPQTEGGLSCQGKGCSSVLTPGQVALSEKRFSGLRLCPGCQKEASQR